MEIPDIPMTPVMRAFERIHPMKKAMHFGTLVFLEMGTGKARGLGRLCVFCGEPTNEVIHLDDHFISCFSCAQLAAETEGG